jgi:hypothetical protein
MNIFSSTSVKGKPKNGETIKHGCNKEATKEEEKMCMTFHL